ncbi:ParM/StbA family protein [bacterium AH-315-E09]|nr:ParM/StbA family protein [Alkaliphilus sp. AH-315-G20]MBN4074656.1 ParM/StbA family protein [bacterium AH-315-E09]
MMKIIGVDKGSAYTKTSTGFSVKSTVRELNENDLILNGSMTVELEGKKYVIGEEGNFATDLSKADHEETKILTLTAIANSFPGEFIETNLVVGLPIGNFSRQKDKMKKIFEDQIVKMKVNNEKKAIVIENVAVFPEAAAVFYMQNKKDCLIIDIGGLSVDNALFEEGNLTKHSTYSMGVMKLNTKIANELNAEYDLSLTSWSVEKIINEGLFVYGKQVPINEERIIESHVLEIVEKIKLEYDVKAIENIVLAGGGSFLCASFFKKHMPQLEVIENSRFSNAIGFEKIGEKMFSTHNM